jgi:hypothetical protein
MQSFLRSKVNDAVSFLMKNYFLFSQMQHYRVEKICHDALRFQMFVTPGENVAI